MEEEEVELRIRHSGTDWGAVHQDIVIEAKTPDVEGCSMKFYWRATGGEWTRIRMKSRGEKHSTRFGVTPEMQPEFEYYLKTSTCGSAKWPKRGYQTVTVD